MIRKFVLLIMLLMPNFLYSQTIVAIKDISDAGNPFHLTGTFVFTQESGVLNVTGHNTATKAILATVIEVLVPSAVQFNAEHDHFFKAMDMAGPAMDYPIAENIPFPLNQIDYQSLKAINPLTGTAKVKWVEFTDGTDWGDVATGQQIVKNREETLVFMQGLLDTYVRSGPNALMAGLSEPQANPAVDALAHMLSNMNESAVTITAILKKRIAVGNTRPALR
jgi:hypothetical protein